jgi:aminopeptidase N
VQAFQEAASESHSMAVGTMNTSSLNQKAMAEAQLATALYSDYFGPLSINHLSITQQTADNYGQAWPGLVYLPITYFFDTTVRHQIGMGEAHGYFRVVEPHEVAHQWWGHLVGWKSYRDQWMSEGFAEFSASLYVQEIYKNAEFLKFWKEERELLTQKNREGFRPIDVGSVTQGERLINSKQGNIYRFMVYPKGAFIVHMIRMMMWDRQQHDAKFRAMMQDFVKTYSNKAASTEDFKAMVEKHMTPQMDIDGSHRMDWYFNEYVYGTSLPDYKVDYSFAPGAQGQTLKLKVTQSNVDKDFVMLVPVYLEFGNGGVTRLGSITLVGNTTFSQEIPLGNVKDQPKKVSVNYYYDVLSTGGN